MQSSRSLRSLGRFAAALLRAAYCGVMFFNRLIPVCVERGVKAWRERAKKRPLQRIEENDSPRWFGWWLRSVLWNQVLMAVRWKLIFRDNLASSFYVLQKMGNGQVRGNIFNVLSQVGVAVEIAATH
ncbi:MAG: hypothetical protein KDD58_16230 [Bdellovibrionales bacterium]|nr:hypothetical protein [Bdellovibrionales bacterium]